MCETRLPVTFHVVSPVEECLVLSVVGPTLEIVRFFCASATSDERGVTKFFGSFEGEDGKLGYGGEICITDR